MKDAYFLGQFEVQIEPQEYVNDITKLQIDGVDQQEKENKYQAFNGGFYLDKTNYKIIMNEPNDGAKLSLTMKDGKVYQYQYNKSTNKVGERLVSNTRYKEATRGKFTGCEIDRCKLLWGL